jgi:hypothetical protein
MRADLLRPSRALWTTALLIAGLASCAPEYRWCLFDGHCGNGTVAGSVFTTDRTTGSFTAVLLQGRTFIEGRVVNTVTYLPSDMTRRPILIDFNNDRKVDPIVGYNHQEIGVIQILLSYGDADTVQYASLTLDGGENPWANMQDVAVGDIDGDGCLDIIAATRDGVVYMHHPSNPQRTHVLPEWGQPEGDLELIDQTTEILTNDELTAILAQSLGPGANLDNYIITVEQGYTRVEIADFDNDGDNDVAAARRLRVSLEPKPDTPVEPIEIVAGSIQVLLNPGAVVNGQGWTALVVGQHERHTVLDREGARDLRAYDLDEDGDLDLISTATDDSNVQVAWFENPGGPGALDPAEVWTQHRIGSVRGAYTIDVADVTGDGRVDVVATSPDQMQLVVFVQPESVSDRGYDWYTAPIVNFESYEPRSVRAIDVDNDGVLELVVGGTGGAVRYFEPGLSPFDEWVGHVVVTFDPPGDVGLLGYGDVDGDGDIDLVAVIDADDVNANRVTWVRNELIE